VAAPLVRVQLGNEIPAADPLQKTSLDDDLSAYVRKCFTAAKDHRETSGINKRMLNSLRAMRGEYDAETAAAIKQFGGSEVYARTTATKVRTLAAALREVYTASERPWTITPTPIPALKSEGEDKGLVDELVNAEIQEVLSATGQPPPDGLVAERRAKVAQTLAEARLKQARDAAELRELQIDDVLVEGGFYESLWALLYDVAQFPIACLKGPVVRYRKVLKWENGVPTVTTVAKMLWEAPSPFDLYFAPWAKTPQDGYIIHRQQITQSELETLKGLPSYSTERIDAVLSEGPDRKSEWDNYTESTRERLENRERTSDVDSGIDAPWTMLEFHGAVPTHILATWGEVQGVTDATSAADITCWMINDYIIGVRRNPHPTGRKPFYTTSFEPVPNSVYGNCLCDLLEDIQSVSNAALRALVNNMGMASGPQVIRKEDQFAPNQEHADKIWPWKIWDVVDSVFGGSSSKPIDFFQPDSNAAELLSVYQAFTTIADEVSSIPRYMNGGTQGTSGALRTASGLSMMMESANRTIKQVVGAIDRDIIETAVEDVHVYLALTQPELSVSGDINIVARGSKELLQKETMRMRRIEFLTATANPIDSQIIGAAGRSAILKEVAKDLGLPVDSIVPPQSAQPPTAQPTAPPQGGEAQGAAPAEAPPAPTDGVSRAPQV
jgi:hypothetical protein